MRRDAPPMARNIVIGAGVVLGLGIVLVVLGDAGLLRAIGGLALIVLPGYVVVAPALRERLGSAGAFAVAGGTAIGLIALGGLVLNLLPQGLSPMMWLGYLAVLLVLGALLHRSRLARIPRFTTQRHEVLLISLGAALMALALAVSIETANHPTESFTQLSIAAASGDPSPAVQISVKSYELTDVVFRVELWRNGGFVRSWQDITLSPGEEWREVTPVVDGRIVVLLFRAPDLVAPYRTVNLQVGAGASPTASASPTAVASPAPGAS